MSDAEDQTLGNPEWPYRVLRELDERPDGLTELEISNALREHDEHKGGERSPYFEVRAEQLAFHIDELREHEDGFGRAYFRRPPPFWSLAGDERTPHMEPDDPVELLSYWSSRAQQARHPVLRARYADLVWDLGTLPTPKVRTVEHARTAITAYQKAAMLPGDRYTSYDTRWLERAVQLAASIRDSTAERAAVACYVEWFRSRARFTAIPTWLDPFICLILDRGCRFIAKDDVAFLVDFLEGVLRRAVPDEHQAVVHRTCATQAADSLAKHYEHQKLPAERARVLATLAIGFEREAVICAAESNHIGGAHWFDKSSQTYKAAGRKEDAIRTRKLHSRQLHLGREKAEPTTIEVPIPAADVRAMEEGYTSCDLETAVRRWTYAWTSRVDSIEEFSQHASITRQLVSRANIGDGWITGRPPTHHEEPDGAMVGSCAEYVCHTAGIRQIGMDAILRHHDPKPQDLYDLVAPSPLLRPERLPLVMAGLEAHLNKDYVASMHILIPQIEVALVTYYDSLPGKSGVKEVRDKKRGEMQAVSMNDVLEDGDADAFLGKDARLHFRACLCHPLGLNLRNLVCHGLCRPGYFTRGYADVVLHCLLVLGLFRGASGCDEALVDGEQEP